jgi:signal transduction histidine kinase
VGLLGGINIIFFKDTLPNHHLTPCCFAITTFLAALAVFKYRFLNLVAVARKEIVDNLAEAILIVNNEDRIISYNHSFSANFSDYNPFETNGEVAGFINYLKSKTDNTRLLNCLNGRQCLKGKEIITWNNNQKSLAVNIRPFRYRTEQVGRIVSFTDITEYQTMLNELSNKNRQLEEYAAAVEELSVMKERNRFARDVHDTTGHTMTLLMALLEVSIINCEKDACGTKLKLQEALRLAKAGFTELRNSIYNLSVRQQESQNLLSPIKKLIADFRHTGMRIELFVEGEILSEVHASYFHVLYRVCQEALTNSLRHGKAELVAIMLCFSDADIKVYIFDNGCGCKEIKPGIGLSGMAQRIQEINGSIVYGSPQEAGGFNINIKIPIDRSAAKEAI